jgi:thiamine-phosphate pyrophosphorylase
MKPLSECRLYAFVDTAYLDGREPGLVARQLCDGGADLVQLRAKTSSPGEIRRMAEAILRVVRPAGVGLVINDQTQVALDVGADFCHLGQEDFFDAGLARISPLPGFESGPGIGLSSHTPDQARRAMAAGAHYVAVGPVHSTPTKPGATPVTLDFVRWAAVNVGVPWFAIGGITLLNLDELLVAGARRICVVSAILRAPDVTKACAEFRKRLDET